MPDFAFLRSSTLDGYMGAWMLLLLRKHRRVAPPLHHLILMQLLATDWHAFKNFVAGFYPSVAHHCCGHEPTTKLQMALAAIESGATLTRASKEAGISVTTLAVEATRAGLAPSKRPKALTAEKVSMLKRSLASVNSLDQIAVEHDISSISLYRILRMHPAVARVRERLLFKRERANRRRRFVAEAMTVSKRHCQDYTWLHRNDALWLREQILMNPSEAKGLRTRVDWPARDLDLAASIRLEAQQLYEEVPPRRVTRTHIARAVGKQALVEKFLDRLPLTALAILEVEESLLAFTLRRGIFAGKLPFGA